MPTDAYGTADAFIELMMVVADPKATNKIFFYLHRKNISPLLLKGRWFVVPSSEAKHAFSSIVLSNEAVFGKQKSKKVLEDAYLLLVPKAIGMSSVVKVVFDFESKQRAVAATRVFFSNLQNMDKATRQIVKTTFKNAGFDAPAGLEPPTGEADTTLLLETHTAVPTMQRFVAEKTRKIVPSINTRMASCKIYDAMEEWMSSEARAHFSSSKELKNFLKDFLPTREQFGRYLRSYGYKTAPGKTAFIAAISVLA